MWIGLVTAVDTNGIVDAFFDSVGGQAALAVLAVGLLNFALAILKAWQARALTKGVFGAWCRDELAGNILPIWALLFVGYVSASHVQFADIPLVLATGIGAAALYVAETVAAIIRIWGPRHDDVKDEPE